MQRDLSSGVLLIAGALAGLVVMLLHPTAHDVLAPGSGAAQGHLNVVVHGVAIATTPLLFLGLLGLTRRLGFTGLATAGLVFWGVGAVAVVCAAVASGSVATGVIERMRDGAGNRDLNALLLHYTGELNQGFAGVFVVMSATAILLWSVALLRAGGRWRGAGILGLLVGVVVLLGHLSGHLVLNVHGFGMVMLGQGLWLAWIGVLLFRQDPWPSRES